MIPMLITRDRVSVGAEVNAVRAVLVDRVSPVRVVAFGVDRGTNGVRAGTGIEDAITRVIAHGVACHQDLGCGAGDVDAVAAVELDLIAIAQPWASAYRVVRAAIDRDPVEAIAQL